MNNLKARLKKQGGFTIVEMLIVVAIVAILIAISIPLINGALENARDATDQANVRAAKAETLLYFMGATDATLTLTGGDYVPGAAIEYTDKVYYNATTGGLVANTVPTAYGKCSGCGKLTKDDGSTDSDAHDKKVIQVKIDANGTFGWQWVTGTEDP